MRNGGGRDDDSSNGCDDDGDNADVGSSGCGSGGGGGFAGSNVAVLNCAPVRRVRQQSARAQPVEEPVQQQSRGQHADERRGVCFTETAFKWRLVAFL